MGTTIHPKRNLKQTLALLIVNVIGLGSMMLGQNVTTIAGGYSGDGRPATKASFQLPYALTRDSSGNMYVGETYGHRIREIASTGVISSYAGTGIAGYGGDGGPATLAELDYPIGVTVDPAGEIVIADYGNNRVRKVDGLGTISTIAGNGTAGYSGDGGPATLASLNGPFDLAYDPAGNLYISDHLNNVIRKVDTLGTITTYAGNGTFGFCGDGGPATLACLKNPDGLVTDNKGDLYISDSLNYRVREVAATGTITTVAGDGSSSYGGDGGPAIDAGLGRPFGLSLRSGVLYIAASANSLIRSVNLSTGIIETSIGSITGYDGDGHTPSVTELDGPYGVNAISSSNIFVVDRFNARLRQLSGGLVKTTAGGFIGDGNAATSAAFVLPEGMAFDSTGDFFIADQYGNRVRKVSSTGKISTITGTGTTGYSGDGGLATAAQLSFPQAVAVDSANDVFIIDQSGTVIRKVDPTQKTITSLPANSNFLFLTGLAVDSSGTLYAADAGSCVIWKFDSGGNASVFAGELSSCGYNGDKIKATSALLNSPWGVTFDSTGKMYISDSGNYRIRTVSTTGTINTVVGNGTACPLSTDACGDGGPPNVAELNFPVSVAVSGATIYIADESDLRIRKVAGGTITTYAGTGLAGYSGNGLPALNTNIDDPVSVAVNPLTGTLYFVDDLEMRVRIVH